MAFVDLGGIFSARGEKGSIFSQNSSIDADDIARAAQSFEAKLQEQRQQSALKNEQPDQNHASPGGGWFDRGLGLLQAGFGVAETAAGAAFGIAASETGVGAILGGAIALHGIDDIQAGLRQAWSGKPTENLTQQAAAGAAEKLGADPKLAAAIGIGVDLAAGGGVGGVERAGVKALEKGGKLLEGGGKVKLIQDGGEAEKSLMVASTGENAENTLKAERLETNKAAGAEWEREATAKLSETQTEIRTQITVKSNGPSGLRTRLDALGKDEAGEIKLSEMKGSPTAPLTPNQKIVHPELEAHGGTVVGKGKAPYVGGTQISPTQVHIIRKPAP